MKFESKFGIGEIVIKEFKKANGEVICDECLEVIAITFDKTDVAIHARHPSHHGVNAYKESELQNDPAFSQEIGYLPEDKYPYQPDTLAYLRSRNNMNLPTLEDYVIGISNDLVVKNKWVDLDSKSQAGWCKDLSIEQTDQIKENNLKIIDLLTKINEIQCETMKIGK